MAYGLTPATLDGTDLQTSPYTSYFGAEDDPLSTATFQPVESEIAGDYPEVARQQPGGKTLPLHIILNSLTEANLASLKKLCDPDKGAIILKATDGTPVTRRLTVYVVDLRVMAEGDAPHHVAVLYAPRPVWEQDSEQSDLQTASASPKTWSITNAGTKRAHPTFEVKPTAQKTQANGWLYRRQVVFAWRSELPGVSTNGLPYPVNVNEGGLDLSAEQTAGRLLANGNDLRVLVDGEEVSRWLDATLVADYVWANISFSPAVAVTNKTAMTAISPANGEDIELSNVLGTLLLPESGDILWGSEVIHYASKTATALVNITRGFRNTTAAVHNAATTGYRVEHQIELVYGYSGAGSPPAPDDEKPVIDLALSTNLKHVYPGPVTASGTLRTGQLLPVYTNDNLLSPAISFLDGATPAFRDTAPSAAAPQKNGLDLYCPCGIKAAAGAIEHDVTVEDLLALEVYGDDMEGFASLLQRYNSGNDGANVTLTPAAVLSRLQYRANLRDITGADVNDIGQLELTLATSAQQFTLDATSLIYGALLRLIKVGSPTGNVQVWIAEDNSDVPGTALSGVMTIAAASIGTSLADHVVLISSLGGSEYLSCPAGKYWLVIKRTVADAYIACAYSAARVYAKGLFYTGGATGGVSGPNSADTLADDASFGANAWANPTNAAASDNSRAIADISVFATSHYLKATDFDFAIPTGNTIAGIEVTVEGQAEVANMVYGYARLVKAGVVVSGTRDIAPSDDAQWKTTDQSMVGGGPTDLWDTTWTPAQVNAVDFGVVVWGFNVDSDAREARVDHITVTVYHAGADATAVKSTAHFAVLVGAGEELQAEAPSGSAAEVTLDNIEITFDNATPRTPSVVVSPQESIYWLLGTLSHDATGQELALSAVVPLNTTVAINCQTHAVTRDDTGESVPGAVTPSDIDEWLRLNAGSNALRYVEAGVGTVSLTTKHRGAFA
ncbi:MAG: hypothetical protein A2Z17_06835 [Gammaproteobacteria bacterium RBG_16_66_13]|nr:MAG: hypothetical protein A2Z17_06835 [Gammaproteobacteria bacterium RBG_16_66_13]